MRDVAIDIETSGLSLLDGAEIIRLSACELPAQGQVGRIFHHLFKPSFPLLSAVTEITGLTDAMLENAPRFEDIADSFLTFIDGARLVCTHASFERNFLNAALDKVGRSTLPVVRFHDLWDHVPTDLRRKGASGIYEHAGVEQGVIPPSEQMAPSFSDLYEITQIYRNICDCR
ncbi:3'-5' exonuclease [Sphingopyxis granuli]|uniref:3'-5' exonuclease n=1 Tax=Sphingopyxis granuli TaxID=267128 RepID=UPI001F537556|nr:3'-5' exonuclease [Sphingopyxis granuli]UNK79498.1 3'-5' exonuclease [Sphingopyxis granuli]